MPIPFPMSRSQVLPGQVLTCDVSMQHAAFDSHPKSIVGTRAYIAPEIILSRFNKSQYNGEVSQSSSYSLLTCWIRLT